MFVGGDDSTSHSTGNDKITKAMQGQVTCFVPIASAAISKPLSMSGLDALGVALGSADVLLRLLDGWKRRQDAHRKVGNLLKNAEVRVRRIRRIIQKYSVSMTAANVPNSSGAKMPKEIFERVQGDFECIAEELNVLDEELSCKSRFKKWFSSQVSVTRLTAILAVLNPLENHLDTLGLMVHNQERITVQFSEMTYRIDRLMADADVAEKNKLEVKVADLLHEVQTTFDSLGLDTSDISRRHKILDRHGRNLPPIDGTGDVIQEDFRIEEFIGLEEHTREIVDIFCGSGVTEGNREELREAINGLWGGWKIDPSYLNVRSDKLLGGGNFSDVFKGELRKGAGGELYDHPLQVAVKRLKIHKHEIRDRRTSFMREVFLQMDMAHPCVLRTYGGFWPAENVDRETQDDFEFDTANIYVLPCMVTERMTCNLATFVRDGVLRDSEMQLKVARDIARGIAYLHMRRVVHRDIKPENVLLRLKNGLLVDIKVSDFGVSRRVQQVQRHTLYNETNVSGTVEYMPPEVVCDMENCKSRRSWDVWSFGVLLCFICHTEMTAQGTCFPRMANREAAAKRGDLGKAMQVVASQINNPLIMEVAKMCLDNNPDWRPKMEDVVSMLSGNEWKAKLSTGRMKHVRDLDAGSSAKEITSSANASFANSSVESKIDNPEADVKRKRRLQEQKIGESKKRRPH